MADKEGDVQFVETLQAKQPPMNLKSKRGPSKTQDEDSDGDLDTTKGSSKKDAGDSDDELTWEDLQSTTTTPTTTPAKSSKSVDTTTADDDSEATVSDDEEAEGDDDDDDDTNAEPQAPPADGDVDDDEKDLNTSAPISKIRASKPDGWVAIPKPQKRKTVVSQMFALFYIMT